MMPLTDNSIRNALEIKDRNIVFTDDSVFMNIHGTMSLDLNVGYILRQG